MFAAVSEPVAEAALEVLLLLGCLGLGESRSELCLLLSGLLLVGEPDPSCWGCRLNLSRARRTAGDSVRRLKPRAPVARAKSALETSRLPLLESVGEPGLESLL